MKVQSRILIGMAAWTCVSVFVTVQEQGMETPKVGPMTSDPLSSAPQLPVA